MFDVNLGKERLGSIGANNYGSKMVIVEYKTNNDIWVKFEQGKPVHASWNDFIKGRVRNPYDKKVFNVGFIGDGNYKATFKGRSTPQHQRWYNMFSRCYNEKYKEKHPTYINCTISDEWHNFQTFAKWYDENYYEVEGQKMHLDKDILVKGNKLYSPKTCVFVPEFINNTVVKNNINRGNLPVGVSWNKEKRKYVAQCNGYIGYYNTIEDAFQSYKINKEKYIKLIAEEYKNRIPNILYNALVNYRVEITD